MTISHTLLEWWKRPIPISRKQLLIGQAAGIYIGWDLARHPATLLRVAVGALMIVLVIVLLGKAFTRKSPQPPENGVV